MKHGPSKSLTQRLPWELALLIVVTVVAYLPAMQAEIIWDDDTYVFRNELVRSPNGFTRIWTEPASSPAYLPVLFSMLWAEYQLYGSDPAAYHVINVLLHCLNVVLVWMLLKRLRVPAALVGAMIFALHPVHVESVAWIAERKDVLSGTFLLIAMITWLRYLARPTSALYAWTVGVHLLAMLSKSVAATFPVIALLALLVVQPARWRRAAWLTTPMFVVSLALTLVTRWRESLDTNEFPHHGLTESLWLASRNLAFYVQKAFLPEPLMSVYPKWELPPQAIDWLWLVAAVAVLIMLWALRHRWGLLPLVAYMFFVIMHLPTLGLVSFNYMNYSYVADRYQYLALLAPAGVIAAIAAVLARRFDVLRGRAGAGAITVIGIVLALLTYRYAGAFHDSETLARDNLAKNDTAWSAHALIGVEASKRGELTTAIESFEWALAIKPDYSTARYNLAISQFRNGQLEDAERQLARVIELDPLYPDARYSRGVILSTLGRDAEAILVLESALVEAGAIRTSKRVGTTRSNVLLALASATFAERRFADARRHYTTVLESDPAAMTAPLLLTMFLATWNVAGRDAAAPMLEHPRFKATASAWEMALADFHRERLERQAIIRAARADGTHRAERLAEAHYHMGMRARLMGDVRAARAAFLACRDTGAKKSAVLDYARRELDALKP